MGFKFNTLLRAILAGSGSAASPAFTATLDQLVNLTGGGTANVFMTGSSGGGGVITAKASASRLTGVAPLYVNIDMTDTTSTLSSNPSHELFFSINWGDPGAGQWANGVQSAGLTDKNWSFGPVSGHVFETPGTYVITPSASDGVNTATRTKTIVVQDPNVVYAGALTICISNSNNFTGAPSGATQVNRAADTDMYAAWVAHKASNKRILFCKADSWISSAAISFSGLTGTMLNGYGTGAARDAVFNASASDTLVNVTPATFPGNGNVFNVGGSTDCHIGNLRVAANGTHTTVTGSGADSTAFTMYKVETRGATASVGIDANSTPGSLYKRDQHCIYECLHDDPYGYKGLPSDTHRVASAVGAVGTPGIFTAAAHPFTQFDTVQLFGTPPTGLSTGVNYYIALANLTANTFSLNSAVGTESSLMDITVGGTCEVRAMSLSGGQGMFLSLTRGGFMGNYLDNRGRGEQTLRTQYLDRVHVNNNYIARPNQTKNIFKIHCRDYDDIYTLPGVSGYSEKIVISANVMDMRNGYSYDGSTTNAVATPTIIIGNGGAGTGQRVRNGIVENNITYACLGSPKDLTGFIECNCPNMTIRNNIADMSMGDRTTAYSGPYGYSSVYFATITTSTSDQTTGVRLYNNTLYTNCASLSHATFVLITAATVPNPEADNITIKNNVWYTPFYPGPNHMAVRNIAGTSPTITQSNNTDTVSGRSVSTAPNFAVHPPVALADWRPNTGSYAIDTGAAVPVLRDFNMATRSGTYDMGAVLP